MNILKGGYEFDLLRSWGKLTSRYSVPKGASAPWEIGIDESPEPPGGCDLVGIHVLHVLQRWP